MKGKGYPKAHLIMLLSSDAILQLCNPTKPSLSVRAYG